MMKKCQRLFLSFIVILSVSSWAKASSPVTPWSQVILSTNGKYVLVLISPRLKEQEKYIFHSRELWRNGGIAAKDISHAEKSLQEEINKETAIRKKYKESGLYTLGKSPKLIWKTDFFDMNSWVKVSDSGKTFVVVKSLIPGIVEEEPLEYNPEIKRVVKAIPDMNEIILTFYFLGKPLQSYKANELVKVEETSKRLTDSNFFWGDEGGFDETKKLFTVEKRTGEKLEFDFNGTLITGSLQKQKSSNLEIPNSSPRNSERDKSYCSGSAFIIALMLILKPKALRTAGRKGSRQSLRSVY